MSSYAREWNSLAERFLV